MTVEINPQFATEPVPECHLDCHNGGYCNFKTTSEGSLAHMFLSGEMLEHCVCPPGYSGILCENTAEQCQDMKCHNGAPCTLSDDGQYVCDCSHADVVSHFAGNMCRDPSTSYCGHDGDLHNRGFCTNGGLCNVNLSVYDGDTSNDYATHHGCHCPPEFEGPHCEYLKGFVQSAFEELHLKSPAERVVVTKYATANGNNSALPSMASAAAAATGNDSSVSPPPNTGILSNVGILFVGIAMSVFSVAFLAQHQRRRARDRYHRDLLNRAAYVDQTPIRVQVHGELESPNGDDDGYYDDDDLHSVAERSECSLEEIEFGESSPNESSVASEEMASNYRDYLQSIRNGGYQTYFEQAPDLSTILGERPQEDD